MTSGKEPVSKAKPSPHLLFGMVLLAFGLAIPVSTYYPVFKAEVNYQLKSANKSVLQPIVPVNTEFSIVIPKINASAAIIKNVNPLSPDEYQKALTKGVAHAVTSNLPNQTGNVFLFAHSAGNWYQANQFNAVFYLISKLNIGDEIIIYYQNTDYHYFVTGSQKVFGSDINYLKNNSSDHQLTLMTCWPPGTTLKRQIVTATLKSDL